MSVGPLAGTGPLPLGLTSLDQSTGGTITVSGGQRIHTFTSSGTFTASGAGTVSYLAVAGGQTGDTGSTTNTGGNGGFGGEVLSGSLTLQAGSQAIAVGAPNSNSSIGSLVTATGAGASGGAGQQDAAGTPGNAGTESSISGAPLTYGGGGGGGAGTNSAFPQSLSGGSGGAGGGGNGGNTSASPTPGGAGTANTGGGGGGGGTEGSSFEAGGAGGSGIVIISYTYP